MLITLKQEFMGQPAGKTVDVSEKDAQALIAQDIAAAAASDTVNQIMAKAVETAAAGLNNNLNAIITAALKEFRNAQGLARKHAVPALFGEGGDGNPEQSFGDWLINVGHATSGSGKKAADAANRLEKVYGSMFNSWQKALGASSGAIGGYTVPPLFYEELLSIAAEEATFRQGAFVQPMASMTMAFPYLDITKIPADGTTPLFGGNVVHWTAEAQARKETEPSFKLMELKAHELSGYTVSSNVLLADNPYGLERFLKVLFGKAVAWYEEFAFLRGDGVGKPLGILNAPARVEVQRAGSGHFRFADVANMFKSLLPSGYSNAVWYISPTVVTDLLQLKDGADRAIFISIDQGATKAPVWKLLNRPVIVTEKLPPLGTTGDVCLVDRSMYVIGDRMQLEIAASEHVHFLKNQMTWRFVQRVDGQPWLDHKIKLQDTQTEVSPFVILGPTAG